MMGRHRLMSQSLYMVSSTMYNFIFCCFVFCSGCQVIIAIDDAFSHLFRSVVISEKRISTTTTAPGAIDICTRDHLLIFVENITYYSHKPTLYLAGDHSYTKENFFLIVIIPAYCKTFLNP